MNSQTSLQWRRIKETMRSGTGSIAALWVFCCCCANVISPVAARVAGKIGYNNNYYSGRSYSGINDEIIWVCIGMGVTILVLISMALCYILQEKCKKRREFYITA